MLGIECERLTKDFIFDKRFDQEMLGRPGTTVRLETASTSIYLLLTIIGMATLCINIVIIVLIIIFHLPPTDPQRLLYPRHCLLFHWMLHLGRQQDSSQV